MPYRPNDPYAQKAKREHYPARSVYKLQEIDQKWALFRAGQSVLDLGCAPGSWSLYAAERVGPKGRVLGIDLTEVAVKAPNAVFYQGDIYTTDFHALATAHEIPLPFDLVISDMAPKTTGSKGTDQARSAALCEMALAVAQQHLRPGGAFVCKLFDGPDTQPFRAELQHAFEKVAIFRPKAVRKNSKEIFFAAVRFSP